VNFHAVRLTTACRIEQHFAAVFVVVEYVFRRSFFLVVTLRAVLHIWKVVMKTFMKDRWLSMICCDLRVLLHIWKCFHANFHENFHHSHFKRCNVLVKVFVKVFMKVEDFQICNNSLNVVLTRS